MSIMDVKAGDLIEVVRGVLEGGSVMYTVTSVTPSQDGSGVTIETKVWTGEAESPPASPYRSEVIQDTPLDGGCYWPMDDVPADGRG